MFLNTKAEASVTEPDVLSLAIKSSSFCWVSQFPEKKRLRKNDCLRTLALILT